MGVILIVVGMVIVLFGLFFYFSDGIPMIGKLPGDIRIKRENFTFYFPLATSILLSVVISLVIYFIRRFS
ncbi:DUF2905 domain-containing protein [Tunicatimonas pelagia]|uniref:DUF2905 domain-containing protein n=1 Tax=Tunicatimonas pelagia TaxID=931531 RepID=UPI002665A57F|nr:DUF2905 domain-containing protein [Tunicatimonas pelagia]WKN44549.1 DUF2905 domain-containing protein [Tunicatimonas pelagia]